MGRGEEDAARADGAGVSLQLQPQPLWHPAFYALHVWAWKHNPHGMFVDWNPKVSCEDFSEALAR